MRNNNLPDLNDLGRDLLEIRDSQERAVVNDRALLIIAALFLIACGCFAIIQAATGHFLPHDAVYLGMTAPRLCEFNNCRILHFMIHDRISFGGVVVAIGVLYLWLASVPLRQRESWGWWALTLSGLTGFLSFLAYLGYGYLDTWHGIATLLLLPIFAAGLFATRELCFGRLEHPKLELASRLGVGRALLLLTSIGISAAGLTIMAVGMTSVFVPQDLAFIGMSRQAIGTLHPHLVPLIAHDRAGFGGALVSFGVAMSLCVWFGYPSQSLRQALGVAGVAGFGTAIGVHPAIGYVSFSHVGPAVLGCVVFAIGLALFAERRRQHSF